MNVRLGRVVLRLRMVREARVCARGSWERMVGGGCGLVSCDLRLEMGIEMVFWNLRFGDGAFSFNGVYRRYFVHALSNHFMPYYVNDPESVCR